jgi:hypothetical protein
LLRQGQNPAALLLSQAGLASSSFSYAQTVDPLRIEAVQVDAHCLGVAIQQEGNFLRRLACPALHHQSSRETRQSAGAWWLPASLRIWRSSRSSCAARALRYLDERGQLPTFVHAQWLAGGLWYRLHCHEAQRVFSSLAQQLIDLPVNNLAWLLIN